MGSQLRTWFDEGLPGLLEVTGEACTYTPASGAVVSLTAGVRDLGRVPPAWLAEQWEYVDARYAEIQIRASDLAAEPVDGDTLADEAGNTWTVRAWRPTFAGAGYGIAATRDERGRV
jgi:hypothetical protein